MKNAETPSIVLFGATGYTGRLIAEELRHIGRPFVIVGRYALRLEKLAMGLGGLAALRVADATDPTSLGSAFRAGEVVINCAGPFRKLGEPVVRACLDAGAHYVDITGEQNFMRAVYERYDERAREAGVSVVPGMGFEYALGDCAVAIAAPKMSLPLRSAELIYAFGRRDTSRGTRRSTVRILSRRGVVLEHGQRQRRAQAARTRTVRIASGGPLRAVLFTSGEVLTVPRHVAVESVHGWIVVSAGTARIATLVAPTLPFFVTLLRPLIESIATRRPDPEPEEREAQEFTIRAELHDRTGARRAIELRGHDPYATTAAAAVAGAHQLLQPGAPRGVLAPAQLVDPRSFLTGLSRVGLRLVENA